jgi:hypothetical protein
MPNRGSDVSAAAREETRVDERSEEVEGREPAIRIRHLLDGVEAGATGEYGKAGEEDLRVGRQQ